MPKRSRPGHDGAILGEFLLPEEASEPILARPVRAALLEWLTEIWAAPELEAVNLTPRRRALFHGAPGTGKTTLAHHLAARLGLPLLVVRPDDIHGRFVGSGTANIKRIFDEAERLEEPAVLFFDEFETASAKRMHGGVNEAVEHDHNAMVNALLARIDAYPGYLIAATNRGDAVDPAIWRRFEIQIAIEIPGPAERTRILARYLAPYGLPKAALRKLGDAFETATPALMRQFCEGLKRQFVVGPKVGWDMRKNAVIERLIAACEPHPDLGKPRLWSHGKDDDAVKAMPWPLEMAVDLAPEEAVPMTTGPAAAEVIQLAGRRP